MARLYRLEEFHIANGPPTGVGTTSHQPMAAGPAQVSLHTEAFEKGYQAGWDDASRTAGEEQTRISAEFSHNLQDLGFTFHEARSHVIRSLKPLMTGLVEKLLPEIIAKTIGQRVLQEIMPLAESATDTPIQVVISPESRPALEKLLVGATTHPLEVAEEPSLGPGQVYLRSGSFEKHIDMEAAISKITEAVSALNQQNEEAFANG